MIKQNIPKKIIKITKMSKVLMEGAISEIFEVDRGLRHTDILSTILFNLTLEIIKGKGDFK